MTATLSSSRAATLGDGDGTFSPDASTTVTWGGTIDGAGGLNKTGAGILTLSGAATHTGATVVSAGTLRTGAASVLSSGSALFLNNGATLDLTGHNQTVGDLDSYNFGTALLDNSTALLGGATLTSLTRTTNNWAGSLQGTGNFIKEGSATAHWYGANTFAGTLTVSAGTLQAHATNTLSANASVIVSGGATLDLNNFSQTTAGLSGAGSVALGSATFTVAQAADTTFTGALSGTGGSLVKSGAGTLTLSGASTFTGGTTVSAGTLRLGASGALPSASAVTVAAGATFDVATFSQTLGSISGAGTLAVGTGTLTLPASGLQLSGSLRIAGGTLALTGLGSAGNTPNVTLDGGQLTSSGGYLEFGGNLSVLSTGTIEASDVRVSGTLSGGGTLTKAGSGRIRISVDATGLGEIVMAGGRLELANASPLLPKLSLASGTSVVAGAGLNGATIHGLAGSGTVDIGGTLSEFDVPPPDDIGSSPTPTTIYTPVYAVVRQDFDTTFSGTIIGLNRLVKEGTGTLTLTGSNTFYEGVSLRGGTLAINGDTALGYAGFADTDAGYTTPGQSYLRYVANRVSFEGGTLRALNTFATSRLAEFPGNGTIEVDAAATLTWNGAFSGSGTLGKTGAGTLTFGGTVALGGLNVQAGTAALTAVNQLSSLSQITLATGATLDATNLAQTFAQLNGAGTLALGTGALTLTNGGSFSGALNTTGGLTLTGGTLVLSGAKSYSGGTSVSGGALQIDTDAALGAGGSTLTLNGGTLRFGAAFDNLRAFTLGASGATLDTNTFNATYSPVITGSGALTKAGAGTLTLSGNNAYTGGTSILGGAIAIDADTRLGSGGLTLNGGGIRYGAAFDDLRAFTLGASGATLDTNGFNVTYGHAIDGTGALTKTGAGTLTLSGANGYSGGSTLAGGILAISADANLGAPNSAVTFADGTLQATASFTAARATTLGTGGGTFDVVTGSTLTWNGAITGASDNPLTKLGAGTLILGGTNTYSGDTFVNAGTLRLGITAALSPNTTLHVATGAAFDANGFAQTFAGLGGTGSLDVGAAGIAVAPTGTNTFAGTLAGSGGLTLNGPGTLVLNNANTFAGATTVTQGTLQLSATGALPTGTAVSLASGTTLDLNGHAASFAKLEGSGNVALGTANLTLAQAANATFAGSITGTGGLAKSGTGHLTLTGTHTFSGTTAITGGQLTLNGSAANSAFTVAGGTLGGNGTVGTLSIASNGLLAPGNSPGTLSAGSTTFAGGGSFQFELNNAIGSAGANWDRLAITGSLTLAATSANPFILELTSLTLGNTAGLTANFDSSANYAFTFVTTTTGISGFSADKFSIDTTGFTNPFSGSWAVAQTNGGNDLALTYTGASAIPEPGTYALLAGATALTLALIRRRRLAAP